MFGHFTGKKDKDKDKDKETKVEKKSAAKESVVLTDFSELANDPFKLSDKFVKGLGEDYKKLHPDEGRFHSNHDLATKLAEYNNPKGKAVDRWKFLVGILRALEERGSRKELYNSIVNLFVLAFDLKNRPDVLKGEVVNHLESEFRGRFLDRAVELNDTLNAEYEELKKRLPKHVQTKVHSVKTSTEENKDKEPSTAPRP